MIQYVYILQNDHHKSSLHLSQVLILDILYMSKPAIMVQICLQIMGINNTSRFMGMLSKEGL